MTSRANQFGNRHPRRQSVLEHALELATRSDRLFVSVAENLAGSAIAALSAARRPGPQSGPQAAVDLVSAVPAESRNPLASGTRARSEPEAEPVREPETGHAPGVVPLLRALGRIVAEHRANNYATLDRDERFWTLLRLLDSLARPGDSEPAPEDEQGA